MHPHITVISLGVNDLERALAFYRDGLGLATDGIVGAGFDNGAVAFFSMNPGLTLALWPRSSMAAEAGITVSPPSPTEVSLGHNVGSREEVDAIMARAESAGATVTGPARDRFWGGYSGHFLDPDGHLWEIAWNPAWSGT
jgi:catechol 2,3-dioxygenase-like lactoylglutathione lyase family enzyme